MDAEQLVDLLLAARPENQHEDVRSIPGAGNHDQVVQCTSDLGGSVLNRIASLQPAEQASFIKALAVYEDSLGGLGSVTALHRVRPVVSDPDHAIIDWVLSNTKSYWYYSNGAIAFAAMQGMRAVQARRREEREGSERKREAAANVRKAERATQKLYNAVRRGDIKAGKALLSQGASASGPTPDRVTLAEYATSCGRGEIAALIGEAASGKTAFLDGSTEWW